MLVCQTHKHADWYDAAL